MLQGRYGDGMVSQGAGTVISHSKLCAHYIEPVELASVKLRRDAGLEHMDVALGDNPGVGPRDLHCAEWFDCTHAAVCDCSCDVLVWYGWRRR